MIPSPNLDDRSYQDIVKEAIRLIPHYCKEWTNHNPSDPGITLIELFAWMTEMIIYRLNKVPEKTYLTLLDLVGLSLTPPQSSKALLSFLPVKGYNGTICVKRGTKVSTTKSETADSLIFETEKEILVKNINLKACLSTLEARVSDNLALLENGKAGKGFLLFSGENEIERYIYLADPKLAFLSENNILSIEFKGANPIKSVHDELTNFLEWQYWNGKKWVLLEHSKALQGIHKQENEVYFSGPIEIEETEVEKNKGYYLRAALVGSPKRSQCYEINEVLTNLIFYGEGLNPDLCYCNTDNMVFTTLDITKDFKPFIDIPKYNDIFYLASDEVLSKEDAEIQINFYLSDEAAVDKPEADNELLLKYEYWNGKSWSLIGQTTTAGIQEPQGEFEFTDTTNAFTLTGEVRFKRPEDLLRVEVNSQAHYWIRVRISAGDFGSGGQYQVNDEGKWEWVYDRPVKAPVLNRIRLFYIASRKPPQALLAYNEYTFRDFTEQNEKNYLERRAHGGDEPGKQRFYRMFEVKKDACPVTYFGFDAPFPDGDTGIYFRLDEQRRVKPERGYIQSMKRLGIKNVQKARHIVLKWEYWNGEKWESLAVNDYTDDFHNSGFIEFRSPADQKSKQEFGQDLYWLRLSFEAGSFEVQPRILNVLMNSAYAYNHQSFSNEVLGSSNGAPSQVFDIFHKPVLPGMQLYVRETCLPPAGERADILEEEGEDAIQLGKDSDNKEEIWIRYHEVENFYASKASSRHYCVDYSNSRIIFGDGVRGLIPPRAKNNVKIVKYTTGGGTIGNVGSRAITVLRENIPYVAGVINYYAAEGGADLEDMTHLKMRATNIFKNLNRAVTAEDYEWLALESSTSVARAKCLSRCGKNGEVILVVVPRPDSDDFDLKAKLYPSSELIRRVKEFLDMRKLVGTLLRVEAPVYKEIQINLKVAFRKDVSEIQLLKERVEYALRRALHANLGGQDGRGWPFGMDLSKTEIFNVLEKIEGVHFVESIELIDLDFNVAVEKVGLDEDCLLYVREISIMERKSQF